MAIGDEMPSHPAFPKLASGNHRITSERTADYNCIAWAAGDDSRWWWPIEVPDVYWPEGLPRKVELGTFLEAFTTLGYGQCENAELEPDREKVAIFALNGIPTHAARQLHDGSWSSKLGKSFDISHTLEAIEGPVYGSVAFLLVREVQRPNS
jgi:hypothetical protein